MARHLSIRVAKLAADKKGFGIAVLDLRQLTDFTDFFVLCSGDSDTHVRALAEYIAETLKKDYQVKYLHREGYEYGHWVILDYGSVVVHILEPETREYYELERLWGDAPVVYGKLPDLTNPEWRLN
ncbi:MAG: ribosome silencing factor [bacterium]|nr:ribosome silencing factor [bacterium]